MSCTTNNNRKPNITFRGGKRRSIGVVEADKSAAPQCHLKRPEISGSQEAATQSSATAAIEGVRTFEFRERLWHEPPELDYTKYEDYDDIQKQLKEWGEAGCWVNTNYHDMGTELELLEDYQSWCETQLSQGTDADSADLPFYQVLKDELEIDRKEASAYYWEEYERKYGISMPRETREIVEGNLKNKTEAMRISVRWHRENRVRPASFDLADLVRRDRARAHRSFLRNMVKKPI